MSGHGSVGERLLARRCLVVAFALIVAAVGLWNLAIRNTDVPGLDALRRDAQEVLLPAIRGEATFPSTIARDHAFGDHAWKRFWLQVSGLVDARVVGCGDAILSALAVTALLVALARFIGLRAAVLLATGVIGVLLSRGWHELVPRGEVAWSFATVMLTVAHFGFMSRGGVRSWQWWLGLAAGTANVILATEGIASAISLVAWSLLSRSRRAGVVPPSSATIVANTTLFAVGLVLWITRAPVEDVGPFSQRLLSMASWPFGHSAWSAIVWAPAIWCVVTWLRNRVPGASGTSLAFFSLWSLVQVLVLAAIGVHDRASSAGILLATLTINGASFATLSTRDCAARTRSFAISSSWMILICAALLTPRTDWENILFGPANEHTDRVTEPLRHAVVTGDVSALRAIPDLEADAITDFAALLKTDEFRRILPTSVRPPLPLLDGDVRRSGVFSESGVTDVPGLAEGLTAFGSRSPDGGAMGEFTSAPLKTPFALLQLRVAGELGSPATELVLRTADGADIAPLETGFSATDRWRTVNFVAPRGEFRVVARDHSATSWLAFSSPVEMSWPAWAARKVVRLWPWLAGVGIGLAVVATFSCVRSWRMQRAPAESEMGAARDPLIAWSIVPWIGLLGYATFLTYHIDPTAGPNDSGGYLNSAKLLAAGRIAVAPHMIDGPAAGENEVLPYLPATFRETTEHKIAPTYPVGIPLIFASAATFVGLERAVPFAIFAQLILGVLFTRGMARRFGLPDGWAWFAAGIVALSPLTIFQALQPLSDAPSMVWVTAAVMCAWSSREKPGYAFLAGLATALAVLIRPSNVVCALPVLVCLAGRWRQLALWLAGGIPVAVFQLWYNSELYGSAFATGYGDVRSLFGVENVLPTLAHYATWLPALLTPLVWLAVALPFVSSIPARMRAVLVVWCGSFLGFYALYACTHESWFSNRFVLPAFPAIAVSMAFVARSIFERFRIPLLEANVGVRGFVATAAIAIVLFGVLVARGASLRVLFWIHANREHSHAASWVRDHVPGNAVVLAGLGSGPLTYYSDHVVVTLDSNDTGHALDFFERVNRSGRPVYALVYRFESRKGASGQPRDDGYPAARGTWERLASLWYGDVGVWIRRSPLEPDPTENTLPP